MKGALCASFMTVLFTSCVMEDLKECPSPVSTLRFVYDYNMERANAFHNQVHCLTLYVYDKDGKYVETHTETLPETLSDENYRMNLSLPAGDYHVVAYGGMACENSSFVHTSDVGPGTVARHFGRQAASRLPRRGQQTQTA